METAEQIAALEGFATDNADLERLKELLVEADAAALKDLQNFESLAANDSDFEKLKELHQQWRAKFDAIAFLGLSRKEWFHSRFLAWLLDPKENHGTKAHFLENFLCKTLEQAKNLGIGQSAFPEIGETVWTKTGVTQEWPHEVDGQRGRLDILLVNCEEKFLCAIENKVDTDEHSDQLGRYRKALEKDYPKDFTRHCVFLSLEGISPEREEDQKHWVPVKYATILELVKDTLENEKTAGMHKDVRAFLEQYETTLRRNIVQPYSDAVRQLARKIYLENREVIEIIYENKVDYQTEMGNFFEDALSRHTISIQKQKSFKYQYNLYFRFWSNDWDRYTDFKTGEDWFPSNRLLCFELICKENSADVYLWLALGTDEFVRQKIVDNVNNAGQTVFNQAGRALEEKRMALHVKKNILDENGLDRWDDYQGSSIRKEVEDWVASFAQNDFPKMNEVIVNCFREYEARQADSSFAPSHGDMSA